MTWATEADRLDRAFRALADETRRQIWIELGKEPGLTTAELASRQRRITRWAVMKHLRAMRQAGLIETLPEGRRRRHYRDERAIGALRGWLDEAASGR